MVSFMAKDRISLENLIMRRDGRLIDKKGKLVKVNKLGSHHKIIIPANIGYRAMLTVKLRRELFEILREERAGTGKYGYYNLDSMDRNSYYANVQLYKIVE